MIFRKTGRNIRWANEIIHLSWTYRVSRLVQVASTTGIFERLGAGPATPTQVAGDLHLDAAMVEKVLMPLAAMGLVARAGTRWQLSARARATLVGGSPFYQGNTLAHSGQVWSFWNDLEVIVRGKRGGWRYAEEVEAGPPLRSHRDFILAMHNMAMAGRAAELADRVDLKGRRMLMDVGGGPGTYAMALCERNRGLTATVLDLPETVKIAREVIARLGMSGRVRTRVGDWDKDEFGSDNDAVLMSNILHGPSSRAEMKLAKAHRSLVAGGLLIVQDFLMNAAKTGPLIPAMFNLVVGAFSRPELVDRIGAAGFARIKVRPMPERVGTTVIIARK
jgi:hypothetical protein